MSFTFSSLFEPKNCATIIPIPTDKPATKEKNKKLSEFVVPIAPNALGPTKFQQLWNPPCYTIAGICFR